MRRLVPSLCLALALAAFGPSVREAPAQGAPTARGPSSVLGRYRVEGTHAARGFFAGTLEIRDVAGALRYERRVRFDLNGPYEIESGNATLSGSTLTTLADAGAGSGGFSGGLGSVGGAGATLARRGTYQATAGGGFAGTFDVPGGSARDHGSERFERAPLGGDSFELLIDGQEFYPRLTREVMTAQRSVHVETFSWENDTVGRAVGRLLAARARGGIEVRVIVDGVGSIRAGSVMDEIRAAGGQVVVARPIGLKTAWDDISSLLGSPPLRERKGVLNREHRKVIVVDGLGGYTGGIGMADLYRSWHDVMCRFEGPVVRVVQDEFLERWRAYGGPPPRDPRRLYHDRAGLPPAGDVRLEVIVSVPGVSTAGRQAYLREIGRAGKKVLIENPYFIDDDVIAALERKARSGVPVTVIVPNDGAQDQNVVAEALNFVQSDIVRSGVDLRKYRGRMVHAKVAAIDGLWSTVGSHNLDELSFHKLSELNVAAHDPRVAALIERRIFALDIPGSDKVLVRPLSFWQKLKTGFFHFFRSFM